MEGREKRMQKVKQMADHMHPKLYYCTGKNLYLMVQCTYQHSRTISYVQNFICWCTRYAFDAVHDQLHCDTVLNAKPNMSQHMQMGIHKTSVLKGHKFHTHDTRVHFAFHIFLSSHLFMHNEDWCKLKKLWLHTNILPL